MGGLFFDNQKPSDIIANTLVRVTEEELAYWTNITCLYDKHWEFNPGIATVPICFMSIINVTESITAEAPRQRVIVYEAPKGSKESGFSTPTGVAAQHPMYSNNVKAMMDNIVVSPKVYKIDCLVANSLIGPYERQGIQRLSALSEFIGRSVDSGDGGADAAFFNGLSTIMNVTQSTVSGLETASAMIDTLLGGFGGGNTQIATINKNSMLAMAESGHLLLMKKWVGYTYSYGAITNIDIIKRTNEDGVFRATLTFQELPILNITKKETKVSKTFASRANYLASLAARKASLAISIPFIKLTGVVDEAGAPGTDGPKGSVLDLL